MIPTFLRVHATPLKWPCSCAHCELLLLQSPLLLPHLTQPQTFLYLNCMEAPASGPLHTLFPLLWIFHPASSQGWFFQVSPPQKGPLGHHSPCNGPSLSLESHLANSEIILIIYLFSCVLSTFTTRLSFLKSQQVFNVSPVWRTGLGT